MEIGFFLDGAQRYLDNACNVLSIFDDWQWQFSRLGLEKLSCMVAITLRHVNDTSSALLACRVSARAKRVPLPVHRDCTRATGIFTVHSRIAWADARQPVHFASAISGG
jgi:hypothetical protein